MTQTVETKAAYEQFKAILNEHGLSAKMLVGSQHLHTGYVLAAPDYILFHATRDEELKAWFLKSPSEPVQADKHFLFQNGEWDDFRSVSDKVHSAELAEEIFEAFVTYVRDERVKAGTAADEHLTDEQQVALCRHYEGCDPW